MTQTRGTILLVDDEPLILAAYSRMLRRGGYTVFEVETADAVPPALANHEIDMVVSDVRLGETSGIDVLRMVHDLDPDMPVALMTGAGDVETAAAAVEHGALRYVLKPLTANVLSGIVEQGVRVRQESLERKRSLERSSATERARRQLDEQFTSALAKVRMVYQPIVHWPTRSVYAYEALLRSDDSVLATPDRLIAAAEQLGRVHDLGRTVRASVARSIENIPGDARLFVNLHAIELEDPELLRRDGPLVPHASRIVLELTERASIEGGEMTATVETLRGYGFKVALDDLGAGYAGLSWFALLRPDMVKLDMSLVRDIDRDRTRQKLVSMLSSLCRELDVRIIGEGVERDGERDTLHGVGCELLQGYHFSRPGPPFPTVPWDAIT